MLFWIADTKGILGSLLGAKDLDAKSLEPKVQVLTTLKEIDQLDESKFNTILRPKAKSRPPKDCDILGFDMEWQTEEHGNDNVLSCQQAWYRSTTRGTSDKLISAARWIDRVSLPAQVGD